MIPPLDLAAIATRGRRLRMQRTALVAAASILLIAVSVPLAIALTRSAPRTSDLQPAESLPEGGPVSDGDVTFRLVTVQCSEDSFEVGGPYCFVHLGVTNDSSDSVSLQDGWQALHFGDQRIVADNAPFRGYFEDYFTPDHAFGAPLKAGTSLDGSLFFHGIPAGSCPDAIELHSSKDSGGVVQQIDDCVLGGGQPSEARPRRALFSGRTAGGKEVTAAVGAEDGEVCFDIPDALRYKAAHLHLRSDQEFGEPILAVFFEPPAEPSKRGCVPAEKFDEEHLTSGSTTQYVDLHISETERLVLEPASSRGSRDG